jgi:hypothetical protein
MDHAGVGVPFWMSGLLVLVTLPLSWALVGYAVDQGRTTGERLAAAVAEITNEYPIASSPDAEPTSGG